MQGVGEIRGHGGAAPSRRSRSPGGFVLPGPEGAAGGAAGAGPLSAAAPLGLLAIQERPPDPGERDERAARRGRLLLQELQEMQQALLGGRRDPARLQRLAALAEGELPADPVLREVMEAVVLRARVEIARAAAATSARENLP
ncbi:flagellar assembly protein FliX [Roseomonas sp. OT10]|uniref:flagellar assembly protein FliX n=1 Tax=Roseomonas cutis TaxID=2897332 RepID=UPI001E4898DC|nr:flagellar assembly protein FliX [Roseomonas sp. OT10]UFN48825.1 flagellar assembly protein FliX [Roseomonas sp. OT10]